MEVDMLHAAGSALLIILDWHRLIFLFAGVCMGLALGLLPGIGGVAGTALLLPFTYNMDAHAAFGMLLGLGSTTTTADPISAILFGAPGHAASAATTLDGYPLTRKGQAGRALGASYKTRTSSRATNRRPPFLAVRGFDRGPMQRVTDTPIRCAGASALAPLSDVEVVVCPPFPWLTDVARVLQGSNISLGAQTVHSEVSGASTGAPADPFCFST